MASLPHTSEPAGAKARKKEMAERAIRIAAMLARWDADDTSGEPEWSIEDLEPMTLRQGPDPETHRT